jgi:hypothetical protein
MPTRQQALLTDVYVDLDKLISEPLRFKLNGTVFTFRPVQVEEFYKLANAFLALGELHNKKELTQDEFVNRHYALFQALCPEFKVEHVRSMTVAQVAALVQAVRDHVHGHEIDQETLEKKTLKMVSGLSSS